MIEGDKDQCQKTHGQMRVQEEVQLTENVLLLLNVLFQGLVNDADPYHPTKPREDGNLRRKKDHVIKDRHHYKGHEIAADQFHVLRHVIIVDHVLFDQRTVSALFRTGAIVVRHLVAEIDQMIEDGNNLDHLDQDLVKEI